MTGLVSEFTINKAVLHYTVHSIGTAHCEAFVN